MFYVYTLSDPRSCEVFYVGKGRGDRVDHHERDARAGKPGEKCELIRDILAEGLRPTKTIAARFIDESEAYAAEAEMISQIGLDRLTNVYPGGGVGRGIPAGRMSLSDVKANVGVFRFAIALWNAGCGLLVMGKDLLPEIKDFTESLRQRLGADKFDKIVGARFA